MSHIYREKREIPIPENGHINKHDGRVFVFLPAAGNARMRDLKRMNIGRAATEKTMYPNENFRFYFPDLWEKYYGGTADPLKRVLRPGMYALILGISYEGGIVDIAPASVKKIKGKMRRKARSLRRWAARNDVDTKNAAKAFIRIFNRKLLETSDDHDLTWSYWYFPVINTDKSLKEIDHYAQECIRFIVSGRHTKARFNVRYEDMKGLGYRCLVNEYHKFGKENQAT